MGDIRQLMGQRGEAVGDALRRLVAGQQALRLLPGKGVLLTRGPSGVVINARAVARGYAGAWAVAVGERVATVSLGFVNGMEPLINGRPMSGMKDGVMAEDGPPRLGLDEGLFAGGKSWIAIRAKVHPGTGKILGEDGEGAVLGLSIVQVSSLVSKDETVAMHGVAMLRRGDGDRGFGVVHQIGYFDYQHLVARQHGRLRHFFCPA